jgi:hypothetical protein
MKALFVLIGAALCIKAQPVQAATVVTGMFLQVSTNSGASNGTAPISDSKNIVYSPLSAPTSQAFESSSSVSYGPAKTSALVSLLGQLDVFSPESITLGLSGGSALFSSNPGELAYAGHFVSLGYSFFTNDISNFSIKYGLENSPQPTNQYTLVGLSNSSGYINYIQPASNSGGVASGVIGPGNYYLQFISQVTDSQYGYQGPNGGSSFSHNFSFQLSTPQAVPEPTSWIMMLVGFGMIGATIRSRRAKTLRPQNA